MDLRTKCELECVDPVPVMSSINLVNIPKNESFGLQPSLTADIMRMSEVDVEIVGRLH